MQGVVLELAGDRIKKVTTEVAAPPGDAERVGGLVIPGLANAHSHAFQRALRGRTQSGQGGSFWTWREQMYAVARALDRESMFALARATFAEMALAGVTLVGEFHYLHHDRDGRPYAEPNAMGAAIFEAAHAAGVRLTLLDTCYLHGGIGAPPDATQLRFSDGTAERWAARVDQLTEAPARRVGAAIHSVRAVDPDSAAKVAAWAENRKSSLHAHVSEQPAENEACLDVYGATPTELLEQAGALSQRFTAVHATHVSDRDVYLLGQSSAHCCLCPTTERDLADGIGPAWQLRQAGARLALGSDSHAMIEPLEEARAVELDDRLASGVRGRHTAIELLEAATKGGYESLGWPEGGVIGEGSLADLVAFRLDSVRLAGVPAEDLLQALVFAGSAADVSDVLVGGQFVVRGGIHLALDAPRELQRAIAHVAP